MFLPICNLSIVLRFDIAKLGGLSRSRKITGLISIHNLIYMRNENKMRKGSSRERAREKNNIDNNINNGNNNVAELQKFL